MAPERRGKKITTVKILEFWGFLSFSIHRKLKLRAISLVFRVLR